MGSGTTLTQRSSRQATRDLVAPSRFSAASASIALVFFALFGVIFELMQYL
jgi:hypothetical protein